MILNDSIKKKLQAAYDLIGVRPRCTADDGFILMNKTNEAVCNHANRYGSTACGRIQKSSGDRKCIRNSNRPTDRKQEQQHRISWSKTIIDQKSNQKENCSDYSRFQCKRIKVRQNHHAENRNDQIRREQRADQCKQKRRKRACKRFLVSDLPVDANQSGQNNQKLRPHIDVILILGVDGNHSLPQFQ